MKRAAMSVMLIAFAIVVSFEGTASRAMAFFTSTGAGTGPASVGALTPVTVAALVGGDAPTTMLLPGTSADVILRIDNPNAFAVLLMNVTRSGAIIPDAGHPGCTTTGVTFTDQSGLNVLVPAGSSLVHLPAAAQMDSGSSSGCQGAAFSIPVTLTVRRE
jgi:hypothetical protein